jgi:ribonuclease-3
MHSPERTEKLKEIKNRLKIPFLSDDLINQALTHSSYVNENKLSSMSDNERLEFLGDAVLKLIVSSYIYKKFPEHSEGDLTKMRAAVVSDLSLSEIAKGLDTGRYLLLGKNEKSSGGDRKKSNMANALEAIIAAVYLDQGLEKAKEIVVGLLKDPIERASAEDFIIDYKSALQELCQKNKWGLPYYAVKKEVGPKHKRIFWIEVKVKGMKFGFGKGFSKKEAEQNAAKEALFELKDKKIVKTQRFGQIIQRIIGRKKE